MMSSASGGPAVTACRSGSCSAPTSHGLSPSTWNPSSCSAWRADIFVSLRPATTTMSPGRSSRRRASGSAQCRTCTAQPVGSSALSLKLRTSARKRSRSSPGFANTCTSSSSAGCRRRSVSAAWKCPGSSTTRVCLRMDMVIVSVNIRRRCHGDDGSGLQSERISRRPGLRHDERLPRPSVFPSSVACDRPGRRAGRTDAPTTHARTEENTMQSMTGGQALAASLKAEGIDHVFGIVGTHNCPLFDGVHGESGMRVVTVRHEQGASMMAAGYARASGKIAACFVVPGPGLTNALTGMGMAHSESAPMLVFAGQNAYSQLEREGGHFHELVHSVDIARAVCGYATRASSPGEVPRVVREAMRAMRCQRPRPAYVEIPLDVQTGAASVDVPPPETYSRPAGDPAAIARAVEVLRSAKRPFIFAGGGVASGDGSEALVRVAEALGAPVVTSMFARGVISDRHPLALGDGWGRLNLYEELLAQADVALVVGSRIDVVSDVNVGARFPERIVQIDIDPLVVGQRRPVTAGVVGDAGLALSAIAGQLPKGDASKCWFDIPTFLRRKRAWLAEHTGPVMPLIEDLRAALPDDAIVVDDLTLVGYWMPVLFPVYEPRTLIHPGTYGTLGYSLPAAIGAKLACPDRTVVSISGDGGFMFTLQELSTAVVEGLDLIALVFNDGGFGAIKHYQDRMFGGRHIGTRLSNPDFVKLGESFGAQSARVAPEEVGAAVRRAREAGGVWLIEVPFAPQGSPNMVPWMP
ncbi:MAG: thiamine pyrophosphate-binding protein [Betaproteobacteria bacterium]|nr:thiamine pyrophosphate-binding protein [Betaproteobacteria bacterium]